MAAPQEMTKGRESWLSTAHTFCYPTRLDNSEQEGRAVTKILDEVLAANAKYLENFGDKGNLPLPPSRHFAILTCMDARLDPAKYAGLSEGDAHVIRNAGGRASDDAIRSLVISYKLLGTREWFVVHHTDCGMLLFTNDNMRNLLASSLKTATLDQSGWHDSGEGPGSTEGSYMNWLTFSDNAKSVVEDVLRIRRHPLIWGIRVKRKFSASRTAFLRKL
jgi:carbonic anhydrase